MLDMKDVVWEELALQSLVDDEHLPTPLAQSLEKKLVKGRDDAIIKHKKMIAKPGFSVLMDRYQSLPNKPKRIAKSRLSELADPILGRLNHLEKKSYEMHALTNKSEWKESSPKKIILAHGSSGSSLKKVNRNQMGSEVESGHASYADFYSQFQQYLPSDHQITNTNYQSALHEAILEAEEEAAEATRSQEKAGYSSPKKKHAQDPAVSSLLESLRQQPPSPHDKIDLNIKTSKNSFASLLRDRIHMSQKVEKLTSKSTLAHHPAGMTTLQALEAALANVDDGPGNANSISGLRKSNGKFHKQPAVKPAETSSSRLRKLNQQKVTSGKQDRKAKKVSNYIDPQSKRSKTVSGSGYGKTVTRYSHLKQPPPPPSSSQRKKASSTAPPAAASLRQSAASSSMNNNKKKRSSSSTGATGRVKSVAAVDNSDNDDEGGTFLTSLLNNSQELDAADMDDDDVDQPPQPVTNMSKFQRKLRASLLPAIPPTIHEKKVSSAATKTKKVAKLPPMEKLVSSGSAPAKLPSSSLRQSVKATHRPTKEDMVVKKQVKSQQRLKEMMEEALREDIEPLVVPSANHQQVADQDDDDDNSLVSTNNYGKKRSMKTNSSIKRSSAGTDAAFQIASMPRALSSSAIDTAAEPKARAGADLLAAAEKLIHDNQETGEGEQPPRQEGEDEEEDIFSSISKLKKFEHSVQTKGTADLYVKADANASLYKHAERLGQHFNNMDSLFKKFNNIKDGLE